MPGSVEHANDMYTNKKMVTSGGHFQEVHEEAELFQLRWLKPH